MSPRTFFMAAGVTAASLFVANMLAAKPGIFRKILKG